MPILIQELDVRGKGSESDKNFRRESVANRATVGAARTVNIELPIDNARIVLAENIFFRFFVVISTLLAIGEPVLVGFPATGLPYVLQIIFLAVSTGLFVIGILMTGSVIESTDKYPIDSLPDRILACLDGEVIMELAFLIIGWACIFESPGVAALRCFRVFRFLWYFELFSEEVIYEEGEGPEDRWFSVTRSSQLSLEYLEKLAIEVSSAASRGGLVILGMYFYVTYVAAVVCWNLKRDLETPEGYSCGTLTACFITMMRLSLYDGTGFDFLWAVIADGSGGLGFLLIAYMCLAAMILLNGLIGVFGSAFTSDEIEDAELQGHEKTELLIRELMDDLAAFRKDFDDLKNRIKK